MASWKRALRLALLKSNRWLWETKAIWLRALLCLALGIGALLLDQRSRFDQRFRIRGAQPVDSRIVILDLSSKDWAPEGSNDRNLLRALKEYSSINDRFFWNPMALKSLLEDILKHNPKAIGISFFFPPDENVAHLPAVLSDERIVWAAKMDADNRPVLPVTASNYGYNVGVLNSPRDEDGVVRRFSQPISEIPHFIHRLAQVATMNQPSQQFLLPGEAKVINFLGERSRYPIITPRDLTDPEAAGLIRDKIIVVGSTDSSTQWLNTPFGNMPLSQVIANTADNYLNQKWIVQPAFFWILLYLILILMIVLWLLFSYPQSAALVFLFWLGTGLTAFSLWIFDSFYIWVPIFPPLAMMGVAYIIFLGYQLTLKENINWRLQQEKKYLFEVEQLKHNFVSLISHDLKTPIAKIQAICDRLMTQNQSDETVEGLESLRRESSELHRYIQSILRVSRIESRDFRLNKEASDINEIIETVIQQVRPLAAQKQITLKEKLEPMFSLEFDAILIQEVILNLVDNAIKYTPEGGVVEVKSQEIDDQVIISVKDNGSGIPKEDQAKIFQKFYRGENQKMNTKGSGIGLYLVKYFIELHGGKVFLESQSGDGTKIGFRLPIHEESGTGIPLQPIGVKA